VSGLLIFGTAGSVNASFFKPAPEQNQAPVMTPEIEAASKRVDEAKTRLDQARKKLDAAKAALRAADAEFRAARADREALALRQQANQLADANAQSEASTDAASASKVAPVTADGTSPGNRIQVSGVGGPSVSSAPLPVAVPSGAADVGLTPQSNYDGGDAAQLPTAGQ
jgi:hypothetical protein